jgi:hypothetical protein
MPSNVTVCDSVGSDKNSGKLRIDGLKCAGLYVLDKAWAADLYLIYKREPQANGCKSDTDRMRMLYRACETSGWKCSYSSIISQKLMIFPEKIELEAYVNQDKICIRFTDID